MRKTWILAGALLVVAVSAMQVSAHGNKGGRGGMGMGMGRGEGMGMVKGTRAGLANQLGLTADQQTKLDALKATYEEKEKALRDEEQAAFKALLTTEQQAALDAAAAAPVGRGHHRGGPVVNLTTEQQTQFEALRTEFRTQHDALRTEFQTAFEALLTADQKTKLATLKAAGPFGDCIRGELPPGIGATGTTDTGTGSTSATSAAKAVAEDEPAAEQPVSWGQFKNADSE
ncbi:MAG: hypothetical protein IT369_01295 [Candidatus Latescibacteria bacterium]|nr:hypothetical protein [Candidatus Latescibacterota bacterium]